MIRTIYKETKITKEIKITSKDLKEMLIREKVIGPADRCEIYVSLPSGGDYSGCNLDIDDELPLIIRTTQTKNEDLS